MTTENEAANEVRSSGSALNAGLGQWISVNDRLPEISKNAKNFQLASGESDRVLIFMQGCEHIGTYHVNIELWSIPFHSGSGWKPTHWMPLPLPPN